MENVSEAVFILEPHTGRVLEVNQQAATVLGYTTAELLALHALDIFSAGSEGLQHISTPSGMASPLSS